VKIQTVTIQVAVFFRLAIRKKARKGSRHEGTISIMRVTINMILGPFIFISLRKGILIAKAEIAWAKEVT